MYCKTCGKEVFFRQKPYCNIACEKQTFLSDKLKNEIPPEFKKMFNL